jgi:alpha-mannosidase
MEHGEDDEGVWVRCTRTIGKTHASQTIRLDHDARMLRFTTDVEWNERETLLKAAFPVAVSAERWAGETQFGHVFRPTTANTSWEAAKFEACAHRWAHVGEPGFGVALLNATNYGHEVRRATLVDGYACTLMRLSLLRGPNFPDPDADHGHHTLRYAIAPGVEIGDAVELGYALGDALRPVSAAPVKALVTSSEPAAVIDTVKLAEDGSGDLIVRVYEARGSRVATTLHFSVPLARVRPVNLLERVHNENKRMECDGGTVRLALRTCEIATIRVTTSAESPAELER